MSLFVLPRQVPVQGGNTYAGALAYFYAAGTTTPETVYANSARTVAHSNPVVADANGVLPPIWLDPARTYRVRLTTATGQLIGSETDPYPGNTLADQVQASVTQAFIGATLYPRTTAENTAGVVPVNYAYEPGDVRRYGAALNGIADDSAALAAAFSAGHPVYVPEGNLRFLTGVQLTTNAVIRGAGTGKTALTYAGSGSAFSNSAPGTRRYNWLFEDFSLTDDGTGTVGLDLDSISSSTFRNLYIAGFTTAVKIYSPTSGFAVYNRFHNVTAQSSTTGFRMHGTSSNAHVFTACRSNICTDAVVIEDSNDNTFIGCQFESGGDGIVLTATTPGLTDGNHIVNCRFENNSGDAINLGANTRANVIVGNYFVATGGGLVNSGARNIILANSGVDLDSRVYGTRQAGGNLYVENTVAAASSEPVAVFKDSATGSGTPSTVEIQTERNAGLSISVKRGGDIYFAVAPDGKMRIANTTANTNTPSGATARQLPIYDAAGTLLGYIPVYGSAW